MRTMQLEKYTWQTPGTPGGDILSSIVVEIRQVVDRPELFIVILSEHPTNKGKSVTNGFEHFATKVFHQRIKASTTPNRVLWVEHYPPDDYRQEDEYCLVKMEYDGRYFRDPQWAPIQKDKLWKLAYTGEDLVE